MRLLLQLSLLLAAFSANGQRIITAGSAITETVCALGDCSKIIASDRTSLYPEEIQKLPSIGYRNSINAEGIISLKPSLVIAEADYVKGPVLDQVKSAGISVIIIDRVYSLDGTKSMIRELAKALDKNVAAEQLISKIEKQLADALAISADAKISPRVLCVFNRDKSSLSIAGTNTFSEILKYTGAVPAITGVDGYKPLNSEALIASQADCLLMFEAGVQALGGIDGVLAIPGVMQLPAGKKKQIISMEGIKLSNFGPRFGEAVLEITQQLYQKKP